MYFLAEEAGIVNAVNPQAGGSAINGDYITLKDARQGFIVAHITQGNAATVALGVQQAKDVSGTDVKAITGKLKIFANQDCAASDELVAAADALSFTTDAALKNKIVVLQVDPRKLDINNDFCCIRLTVGASHADNIIEAKYFLVDRRAKRSAIVD